MLQLPAPLPTDNFYKFGTILGIVVFISSLYIWVLLQNSVAARAAAVIAATSQPIVEDDPRLRQAWRDTYKNAFGFWTIALFGLAVGGVSARHWYTKHQKLQDELLRLQVETERQKATEPLK